MSKSIGITFAKDITNFGRHHFTHYNWYMFTPKLIVIELKSETCAIAVSTLTQVTNASECSKEFNKFAWFAACIYVFLSFCAKKKCFFFEAIDKRHYMNNWIELNLDEK